MLPHSFIQKITDAAIIEEVIGSVMTLKRNGTTLKACCPFHDEKSPSFVVSPVKQIFKCFGCGKAGDVITFVMEFESLTFYEAVVFLSKMYKIELPEVTEEAKKMLALENGLYDVHEIAQDVFYSNKSTHFDKFCLDRGITKNDIEKWGI